MTKKDYRFFEVARVVAQTSDYKRIKIGAVIVHKKRWIISTGVNSYKTHPIQKKYNKYRFDIYHIDSTHSLHAEIQALINIPYYIEDSEISDCCIYIYRENVKGELANSRPCPSCLNMIKDYGIHKIYYTSDDGFCEEILDF